MLLLQVRGHIVKVHLVQVLERTFHVQRVCGEKAAVRGQKADECPNITTQPKAVHASGRGRAHHGGHRTGGALASVSVARRRAHTFVQSHLYADSPIPSISPTLLVAAMFHLLLFSEPASLAGHRLDITLEPFKGAESHPGADPSASAAPPAPSSALDSDAHTESWEKWGFKIDKARHAVTQPACMHESMRVLYTSQPSCVCVYSRMGWSWLSSRTQR